MGDGVDSVLRRLKQWIQVTAALIAAIIREVRAENLPFMAGSIAYHAFVSILPLMVLSLTAFSFLGGPGAIDDLVADQLGVFLDQQSREAVSGAAESATRDIGLSVFSLLVLLWGASRIFRGVDAAFASIYGTGSTQRGFIGQLRKGIVVMFTIAVGVACIILIELTLGRHLPASTQSTIEPVFTTLTLAVAFFPTYYIFPDEDVTATEVLPGTLTAALGWTGLKALFAVYVTVTLRAELYGVLSVAVLLLLWLYAGGLILLFGAVVNSVLAERKPDITRPDWTVRHDEHSPAEMADLIETLDSLPDEAIDGDGTITFDIDGVAEDAPEPDRVHTNSETVSTIPLITDDEEIVTVTLRWRVDEDEDDDG